MPKGDDLLKRVGIVTGLALIGVILLLDLFAVFGPAVFSVTLWVLLMVLLGVFGSKLDQRVKERH